MFLLATFSEKCAMLLCTVLFMPSPAMGGVPSAPGDVAGAIGAASAENGLSTLAEKSLAHTELVLSLIHI